MVTSSLKQIIVFASLILAFTVSASAQSWTKLTNGPATVSGSTVTLTGSAGTVTIQATQAGNSTYAAATPVSQSFTVSAPGVAHTGSSLSGNGTYIH